MVELTSILSTTPVLFTLSAVVIFCFLLIGVIILINWIKAKYCKHNWLPIRYGLLVRTVDEKGRYIEPEGYIAGGCVVKKAKYECSKCGKQVNDISEIPMREIP